MTTHGGPRKDVYFPIESVTFRKRELDLILSVLSQNIRNSLTPFGPSARFTLSLQLNVQRKPRKQKP